MIELRCNAKLHAVVSGTIPDDLVIEVGCHSRFCSWEKGVVVRHQFYMEDGEISFRTRRWKSPERGVNGSARINSTLRHA